MENKNVSLSLIPEERVESRILFIRGKRVLLDRDLAQLYGVGTKALNQTVRRNIERFPADFMFQLDEKEFENLRSQFVTSSSTHGGRRYYPFAFTEHGVAMLSSVLNSPRAIHVNIQIMRTFTKMKKMAADDIEIQRRLDAMEQRYDKQFRIVFDAIRGLLAGNDDDPSQIGFKT